MILKLKYFCFSIFFIVLIFVVLLMYDVINLYPIRFSWFKNNKITKYDSAVKSSANVHNGL